MQLFLDHLVGMFNQFEKYLTQYSSHIASFPQIEVNINKIFETTTLSSRSGSCSYGEMNGDLGIE